MQVSQSSLPASSDFSVLATPEAGRGVFARNNLAAGTHILTTSPSLSPTAHVVLRPYRREVCAFCFIYDRGREWKIRPSKTGLAFCTEKCYNRWVEHYGEHALQAFAAVESLIRRRLKKAGDDALEDDFRNSEAAAEIWKCAAEVGQTIRQARTQVRPSKDLKRTLRQHLEATVDPDILFFLLSTALPPSETDPESALMALASNPAVYESASLDEHIKAYHSLLSCLQPSLLARLRADLCHEYVARASHNAFSIRPTADGDHTGEFLGYGVWPEASFFNHSCRPNVRKTREGRLWSFSVADDVMKDEELCITYLGGEEKELDVQQRRDRLKSEWGFVCCCARCKEESVASAY